MYHKWSTIFLLDLRSIIGITPKLTENLEPIQSLICIPVQILHVPVHVLCSVKSEDAENILHGVTFGYD